ncbi:uncharacterized protein PHACADRAFT_26281 [Phanerochaete carnosa HHB-10118-sp]|uniref:RNI-like protein n=1 Tax=Phanerochaete carnosa (strain HHB-10118-sp) TaxID=650164 RepID=K5WED5_PHACS|nr:uncharacterized protein PHACADRAFT_26281 [Phanerochaete carnosa HHB-10118-sp]EKM57665.1 hypothetical protein PHACADRAFT_26281 [Phanerochaete carnosa HHB-10118-sp]
MNDYVYVPLSSGGAQSDKSCTVQFSLDRTLYGAEGIVILTCSVLGAHWVCEAIAARSAVTTLNLPHHKLGDEGAMELFRWLCSGLGKKYRKQINNIDVSDNRIGDRGLAVISEYLLGNRSLRALTLSKWDDGALLVFADAVNGSRVQDLALNNVPSGDVFVPHLLSHLTTPYLKSLRISMTGLTERSASAIATFIVSPRCRLYKLSLSGNSLGQYGVSDFLKAMQHSYSLRIVDLFANADNIDYTPKQTVEKRNSVLSTTIAKEARTLLRASRIVLLPGDGCRAQADADLQSPTTETVELPLELRQHILTFLAPHLSIGQCLHIFDYASSHATLPMLAMHSSHSCLPDPSAGPCGRSATLRSPCEEGMCMGASNSLSCRREILRADWLLKVECDVPDPVVASALFND